MYLFGCCRILIAYEDRKDRDKGRGSDRGAHRAFYFFEFFGFGALGSLREACKSICFCDRYESHLGGHRSGTFFLQKMGRENSRVLCRLCGFFQNTACHRAGNVLGQHHRGRIDEREGPRILLLSHSGHNHVQLSSNKKGTELKEARIALRRLFSFFCWKVSENKI